MSRHLWDLRQMYAAVSVTFSFRLHVENDVANATGKQTGNRFERKILDFLTILLLTSFIHHLLLAFNPFHYPSLLFLS